MALTTGQQKPRDTRLSLLPRAAGFTPMHTRITRLRPREDL
jgi:hypothetical protein